MNNKKGTALFKKKFTVCWPHNFSPNILNGGHFVFSLLKEIKNQGIMVDDIYLGNLKNPKNILATINRMRQRAEPYTIMHAQYGSLCGLTSLAIPAQKKILTLRGSDWYGASHGKPIQILHGLMQKSFTRLTLNKYDRIIYSSERMLSESQKRNHINTKSSVLPSGINLHTFTPLDKNLARSRLNLKVLPNEYIICFPVMHTNNPIKRLFLAEEAVSKANKKYKIKLITLTNILNQDLRTWYCASDLILMTSIYEGWPNVIKEALACNIPFVSTDVSDLAIVANKTNSCFVSQANSDELAARIINCIEHQTTTPREDLTWLAKQFSIKTIAKKLINIYKSTL